VCGDLGHRIWRWLSCRYGRKLACLVLRFYAYISRQPPLWSWTWLYHKKANLTQNSTVYWAYGNTANYSQMSWLSISMSVYPCRHCKVLDKNAEQCQKPHQKQPLPLNPCELPSNSWMSGPTSLTTPNDISITVRTSTQRKLTPQNCPFPFNDHHQNLIHPYRARPHSPPQMASGSTHPCCHCSHVRTDRWDKRKFYHISTLLYGERRTNNTQSTASSRTTWCWVSRHQ